MNLYVTADQIGIQTGGGSVTYQESEALRTLGPCEVWDRTQLATVPIRYYLSHDDPWDWDSRMLSRAFMEWDHDRWNTPQLAHFYAGTFSRTVERLRKDGVKVTYTAAAHDKELSQREHELVGLAYDYPHMTDPELWKRYVAGYLAADVLICPSTHSADVMRKYGRSGPIEVIPHGVDLPPVIVPPPKEFRVGYIGAVGPDKGLRYLLTAWKALGYKDATLVLAGQSMTHSYIEQFVKFFGGDSRIERIGWTESVSDFYNNVSVLVQPSVTEGFGCTVLEAMAHGRPVVCSRGAGASDVVPREWTYDAFDVDRLATMIDVARSFATNGIATNYWRSVAERYAWDKVRARYVDLWSHLLS